MNDGKELLVCKCHDVNHQIVIEWFEEDGEFEVYAEVLLKPHGFWKRLWTGIRYICGHRSKCGDFDEFMFSEEHIRALERIVSMLKHNKKNAGN